MISLSRFNLHFLITGHFIILNYLGQFFIPSLSSLRKCSFKSLAHFSFIGLLFSPQALRFENSLYRLDMNSVKCMICRYFLVSFEEQNCIILMKSKEILTYPVATRIFFCIFFPEVIASGRSVIHF